MTEIASRVGDALAYRYRVERELGAGGMATVYLAQDLRHQRQVAIKVLRPELAAMLGAERFVQEITTTAQLQPGRALPRGVGTAEPASQVALRTFSRNRAWRVPFRSGWDGRP